MRSWVCTTTAIAAAMLCLPLGGCASHEVSNFYDAQSCSSQGFVAMVACGKSKREAYCHDVYFNNCTSMGNAFVQYADALAAQVQSHQITEADAMARFAEYKSKVILDAQRNEAPAASAPVVAPSGPRPAPQSATP